MSDAEAALDHADMESLTRGHDSALDDLMARHAPRLHAYLFRLLQNPSDAEDLAQETFVRVYEHRDRFDPRHKFTTWLYTIATNLVRDRYRWRSRHPESPLDTPLPSTGGALSATETRGLADVLPGPDPGPDGNALRSERAEAVRRAVADLPEELRIPILLSEFEERSHEEIGEILKCSAKAVEMRVYRARKLLRETLSRWLGDGAA